MSSDKNWVAFVEPFVKSKCHKICFLIIPITSAGLLLSGKSGKPRSQEISVGPEVMERLRNGNPRQAVF